MKKPILLLGLFCLYAIVSKGFSQTNLSESLPYIEVNGYAEKEVIPNEIYIGIILRERIENKEKISIEFQEKQLKESLNTLSIPISNLSMADANADFIKVRWQKKDVITKKEYVLKVATAVTVGKVFQELEKMKILDGYIDHVSHSAIDSLRKVVRIEAIKAAKEKADYLLNAIGETTGKAMILSERESSTITRSDIARMPNKTLSMISGVSMEYNSFKEPEIEFQKIKLSYSIYTKFAIQ